MSILETNGQGNSLTSGPELRKMKYPENGPSYCHHMRITKQFHSLQSGKVYVERSKKSARKRTNTVREPTSGGKI